MPIWAQASWQGPPDSNFGGPAVECRGLVEHIAEGSYGGTIGWQQNPISDVSSHFVMGLNGEVAQMLDTNATAWTQAAGNGHWVSAEFAGFSTGSYTPQQQEAASQLYAWLVQVHGVPLQLADSPSGTGWGWHGMGGVAWGNHPNCPGSANVALRTPMLARTIQILGGGGPAVLTPGRVTVSEMFRLIDPDNAQFVISPDSASTTGWSYVEISPDLQGWMLVAAGIGTANGSANDPNHDPHANNSWRPGTFGPSKAAARESLIVDIAARVVASLPPGQGGQGPTLADITAAVRTELNKTKLPGVPGQLGV
jgi:hypothetical protein